jgi:hypothetical protein
MATIIVARKIKKILRKKNLGKNQKTKTLGEHLNSLDCKLPWFLITLPKNHFTENV